MEEPISFLTSHILFSVLDSFDANVPGVTQAQCRCTADGSCVLQWTLKWVSKSGPVVHAVHSQFDTYLAFVDAA